MLATWTGTTPDGRWTAPSCGLLVPRQNGKTEGVNLVRVLLGLLYLGERIIFTSHRQDAATEFYQALVARLDRDGTRRFVRPDGFRGALGRERIIMRDGGSVTFVARSNKGGRSKHSDLIVFDEAQYLDSFQMGSFTPTQETSPNPQIVYTGTPPDTLGAGDVFGSVRKRALSGESDSIAWCEWAVRDLPDDVSDRSLWYETNPSLGTLIGEQNIRLQLDALVDREVFAREVLGWWAPERVAEPSAIPVEAWDACETDDPPAPSDGERVACGIKFSADGGTYSVSMAARPVDGPVLVECVNRDTTSRGVSELVDWVMARKSGLSMVCVDGREWTSTLTQRLADLGFPTKRIHVMRTRDLTDACAMLANAVEERTLAHAPQPLLRESVGTSPRRKVGSMGWGFGGVDPTPIESCALAHWGAMTTKRNPRRRLRVG